MFVFFNDTATTEIYTLSLHDALPISEASIWTSALATADFLSTQLPNGSAYVIGEAGLTTALYEAGYTLTDTEPDYVVLRSEEHTSELQSRQYLVCRLLLEKKKDQLTP